jgi:signal transduction histidine kinase
MRTFFAQPLRRQLLMANLLLAIPVLGLAAWQGVATVEERREDLADRASNLARGTAAYLERDLENFGRIAARLSAEPAVQAFDRLAAGRLLALLMVGRPAILDVVLVDLDAREVARAAADRPREGTLSWAASSLRPQPGAVTSSGGRLEPLLLERTPPARHIVFAYPVLDRGNRLTGALGIYLDLGSRHEVFSIGASQNSVVAIANDRGLVLAQSDGRAEGDGAGVLAGHPGALPAAGLVTGADGIERWHATALVGGGPWRVGVAIPTDGASLASVGVWGRSFAVVTVVLAGCFLMAWFVSGRVARSVSHLEATARRIATGDFSPIRRRPMFSPEFAELQMTFDAMLQRFNATRAALDAQMAEERRMRKELESLQGQIIQQERLAAVGQLVSGVAHEINNPLQAILGFAELLQMQSDVPESIKGDLQLIQKESTRACNIIRNLAMFARQDPGEAAPVHMTDVIKAVAELRQRRLQTEDIELHIDDRAGQAVKAVLTELQQVLLNFVVNAEQAILNSGRRPGRIAIRSFDTAGRVVLEVEDTGPGVPPGNESKLFQPFFTTKPVGQGTGLGLSISYGIIDSLGGTIGYRRATVGGAIFYFELPAATMERDELLLSSTAPG